MAESLAALDDFVKNHVQFRFSRNPETNRLTLDRIVKTFSLLPEDTLRLFLLEKRDFVICIEPDLTVPFSMATVSSGPPKKRKYQITIYNEQQDWSEDLFIGSLLREIAHVVSKRPPEQEWPTARGDKARYKERLEYLADATVWKWGLRHYSIRHITETYPKHWADKIIEEVARIVLEEQVTIH